MLYTALYLSCEKNENKQKEARFGPFFKKNLVILAVYLSQTSFMRMTNRTTQTTTTATVDTTWKNVFRQKNLRRIFFDFFTVMTGVESFKILFANPLRSFSIGTIWKKITALSIFYFKNTIGFHFSAGSGVRANFLIASIVQDLEPMSWTIFRVA